MDLLTMPDLRVLMDRQSGWHISLFMPTHRAGRETEQDPIRFRNLLRQVEQRLRDKGVRTPEIQSLLAEAQALLLDPGFWMHQSDGLAAFFNNEGFHAYRLPLVFEELTVVSDRFHVKPILPLFTGDGHFYILALSQNQVRLLEGTRYSVDEIDVSGLPLSMTEALQYERFEKSLQFHTGTAPVGAGKRPAVYHGHDASDEDKSRILRWFHRIDDELPTLLGADKSPLVLAGVESLFPIYRDANSYPNLLPEGIPGNPETLSPAELHTRAWSLVQPIFSRAQMDAVERFRQLSGSDKTTTDVLDAVSAALHGRVDTLFVAVGAQVWGSYEPQTGKAILHSQAEPGDEDLLDLAAVHTILNGGVVYALEPDASLLSAPIAAILRY